MDNCQYMDTLGDLLGLDPEFYGDYVSPYDIGDIKKQTFNNPLSEEAQTGCPELAHSLHQSDGLELECLLSEGTDLIDQLLRENGVVLDHSGDDMFCGKPQEESSPLGSPVPTLPSEPASPINLAELIEWAPSEPVEEPTQSVIPDEAFHGLLQDLSDSLLANESYQELNDSYADASSPLGSYQEMASPVGSSDSRSDSAYDDSASSVSCSPSPAKAKRSRKTPYSKLPAPRKERKKQQNKEAANRYRMKKKGESMTMAQQEAELVAYNSKLKSTAENLQREITCMKELLSDVFDVHSF